MGYGENRSAWLTHDKEWMRARRAAWKRVARLLDRRLGFEKHHLSVIEKYFLHGERDENFVPIRLDCFILLELWLVAEEAYESVQATLAAYYGDCAVKWVSWEASWDAFESLMSDYVSFPENVPAEGYFFGRERSIFEFFRDCANRYAECARMRARQLGSVMLYWQIYSFLDRDKPHHLALPRWQAPLWRDAINANYADDPALDALVYLVDSVLAHPEKRHEMQVELARELDNVLKDATLHAGAQRRIARLRSVEGRTLSQALGILRLQHVDEATHLPFAFCLSAKSRAKETPASAAEEVLHRELGPEPLLAETLREGDGGTDSCYRFTSEADLIAFGRAFRVSDPVILCLYFQLNDHYRVVWDLLGEEPRKLYQKGEDPLLDAELAALNWDERALDRVFELKGQPRSAVETKRSAAHTEGALPKAKPKRKVAPDIAEEPAPLKPVPKIRKRSARPTAKRTTPRKPRHG